MIINRSASPVLDFPGEKNFPARSDLIHLTGYFYATNSCTLRKMGSAASYQTPVGKVFRAVYAIVFGIGTANSNFPLGYADNDLGFDAVGSPTNPVYAAGQSSARKGLTLLPPGGTVQGSGMTVDLRGWSVPAGKYPMITGASGEGAICHVYGYEENA